MSDVLRFPTPANEFQRLTRHVKESRRRIDDRNYDLTAVLRPG